ncbi:MAG: ribonuclease R [Alistipes sp.]|nr:ribonuclease R [Alistipes sp.]
MGKKRNKRGNNRDERASFIVDMFREFPDTKFSLKHLAAASGGADRDGRTMTFAIVRQLIEDGFVEEVSRSKYRLSRSAMPRYEGVVASATPGALYVEVEALESDVYVARRNGAGALDGDRVMVAVARRSRDGELEGTITEVVERSRRPYIGTAQVTTSSIFLTPDTRRIGTDIRLERRCYPEVEDGDKLAVRVVSWADGERLPEGELVERLGRAGENDTEMHAILAEFDLPYRFEREVVAAAERIAGEITDEEIAKRRDMREVTTMTIDPADAKDFDDALSLRKVKEGVWEVGVHIADVSHYVTPGSVVDDEAVERATSVYLVDRTVPMLPERLCNDLCSLRPNEDKLSFSAVFTLNDNAEILDEWFGRTVIHSNRRFTYEEAQEVIEREAGEYAEEITTLNRLAQTLRKERFRHGAIAFERDEVRFRLDEKGRPIGVYTKVQKEANQLIEEFMLLANRRVAEFCAHRIANGRRVPRPMVYRVHDEPSEDKLGRFRDFALRFGHYFKASKGRAVAKEMNKLLKSIAGSAEANAITTLAVRSMAKALYTTDNIGHYGLAFPYYTHFTSPIRRYPDIMVHRILAAYLAGEKRVDKKHLEQLCQHSSEREILASDAERASIKYKMAEFMKDRIGEEFEGVVSGMTEWGVYVELDDTHVEGMAFLRDIDDDDYYRFDEARYEVVGRSSGIRLTLGSRVRVRVKSVDLNRRTLDFKLLLNS